MGILVDGKRIFNEIRHEDLSGLDYATTGHTGFASYEEGVWTPGITFGGTAASAYAVQAGYYTKIGNIVALSGYVGLSTKGAGVGDVYITGLPFTVANNNAAYTAPALYPIYISFGGMIVGFTEIGGVRIGLVDVTNAGGFTTIKDTNFVDTSFVFVGVTYRSV
jgi:hypothetical protein